jgi:hypothetical protein
MITSSSIISEYIDRFLEKFDECIYYYPIEQDGRLVRVHTLPMLAVVCSFLVLGGVEIRVR